MPSLPPSPWSEEAARARLALIDRRRRPERRLLGRLALAIRHGDRPLIEVVLNEALDWPEASEDERAGKAALLFAVTARLARARQTDIALRVAPMIPLAPEMTQILVFSTEPPEQQFCWRVTPAYALVHGRRPACLPLRPLIRPYQHGRVSIDHAYLERVLLPRRREPYPILLLPHPLGVVQIDNQPFVILDGNHRVVCAWRQNRRSIPGHVLTPEEAAAILISESQWPPYLRLSRVTRLDLAEGRAGAS